MAQEDQAQEGMESWNGRVYEGFRTEIWND